MGTNLIGLSKSFPMNTNMSELKGFKNVCIQFKMWNLQILRRFGPTYMHGMTGDHLFYFWIFEGDLTIIAYAKFNGFLTVGYISNGLKLLDVTVTSSNTLLSL